MYVVNVVSQYSKVIGIVLFFHQKIFDLASDHITHFILLASTKMMLEHIY